MNTQTLSSIDFSNPEKKVETDSISLILSDRKIDIPLSLIQEFIKIFKDYEKEQKVSFSQEMRNYFQLINPLSLDDT